MIDNFGWSDISSVLCEKITNVSFLPFKPIAMTFVLHQLSIDLKKELILLIFVALIMLHYEYLAFLKYLKTVDKKRLQNVIKKC